MTTVVAVPVKDLAAAKQRLVAALDPRERAELAAAMLRDVLGALAAAGLDHVWVVTRDDAVITLAKDFGAEILREERNAGHTRAVAQARAEAAGAGADVFLTVPGDVPCLTAAEAQALAEAARSGPAAVFTPSRSGLGTNGVALAPPDLMELTFGEPSFDNHLAAARARGLRPRVLPLPGLGLDVDGPADLAALLVEGPGTESGRLLAGWGIARRLGAGGLAVTG